MPNEYEEVKRIVAEKRENQVLGGDLTKQTDFIERALCEYPTNLWDIINANTTPEEMIQFTSKEGARWFVRSYKEFSLVNKI